jgi:hypothetical protein
MRLSFTLLVYVLFYIRAPVLKNEGTSVNAEFLKDGWRSGYQGVTEVPQLRVIKETHNGVRIFVF